MTITVYTFEDANGEDSFSTQDAREAKEYGARYGYRVLANEYEWADSDVAWDFTPAKEDESNETV